MANYEGKGFIWVNRCTGKLLEKPPITMLRDGKLKEIGLDEIDWDWGSSFKLGMFDYVDSIIEGRQSPYLLQRLLKFLN